MELKKPLTIDQQISKLKEHGMFIVNDSHAKEVLSRINYYRLSGYALTFREITDSDKYKMGTQFEIIYDLYRFDADLRNMLRKYLERLEIFYRTKIAYNFSLSKCTEPPYMQHYDPSNYGSESFFMRIIESFERKQVDYFKNSLIVKHHNKKYGRKKPLWVIVELMTFSNLSKLYKVMCKNDKEMIAQDSGNINSSTLENHLHCLAVLRNKCAHAARLYNTEMNPPAKLGRKFLRKYKDLENNTLLAYLIVVLRCLPSKEEKDAFKSEIIFLIEKYKNSIKLVDIGFDENYQELLNKMYADSAEG